MLLEMSACGRSKMSQSTAVLFGSLRATAYRTGVVDGYFSVDSDQRSIHKVSRLKVGPKFDNA